MVLQVQARQVRRDPRRLPEAAALRRRRESSCACSVAAYHAYAERLGGDVAKGVAFVLAAARKPESGRMEGHAGAWKYVEGFIHMGLNILSTDLAFALYNRTEDAAEYAVNLIFGRDTECAPP